MKFFILIFFNFLSLLGAEERFYKKFESYADPLYCPWLNDEDFNFINKDYPECHVAGKFQEGRYLQYVLARNACSLKYGDFIECGIFTGKSLDIFASVLDRYDPFRYKMLYGVDSFEGLIDPGVNDVDVRTGKPFFKKGSCKGFDLETLQKMLSRHKCKIEFIKGWIPLAFSGLENHVFCFAHIDVDLYQATFDALQFVYKRMISGGIILFDDYGFPMCSGSRKAVDAFLKDKPEPLICLPSGQAFLIKQ